MNRVFVVASALVACGGWIAGATACSSFTADGPGPDAATDAATIEDNNTLTDATDGSTATRCAPDAPFGPATQIGGLGNYAVEAVRFGANRSLVYLSLCPSNGDNKACDMYQGTTTTTDDTYGSLVAMTSVNSPTAYDSYPTVTGDATSLIFGSGRSGGVKIFYATATGGVFQSPKPLSLPFTNSNEPYLLGDGHTFYFGGSPSDSSVHWDIYRAEGTSPSFSNVKKVPGADIDIASAEQFAPVVTEDELEIFFASSRAPGNSSNLDIWFASRATKEADFGPATRLADLSGSQNEFPTSISPDACDLYYIRKTSGGVGNGIGTAYVTRRKKP